MNYDHIVNPEMIKLARQGIGGHLKQAFIPGGDPGMGGAPPGGDPSQGGGMPPGGDPSMGGGMPPGGDPSMGGGAPPPPPAGGGGGDDLLGKILQQMQQMQQQMMSMGGGGAGGAGGAAGGLKPKIDVNVEIMQMKNLLAKICDHLGIHVPVQDMTATSEKLNAMAQGQSTATPGGGGGAGAIPPIDPMGGIQPSGAPGMGKMGSVRVTGVAFDSNTLADVSNRAAAISRMRKQAA